MDPVKTRVGRSFVRWARELHLYLGTFFAPAILFFAFTGALQTFGWHEGRPGETYQPPRWVRVVAQLHKKQTAALPVPREGARKAPDAKGSPARARDRVATVALKWFVFTMAAGLMVTTGLGIYMAFKFNPSSSPGRRRLVWMLLALGAALPMAFVLL